MTETENQKRAQEILATLRDADGLDVDTTAWVSIVSLSKLLAGLGQARQHVTELQAHNTALHAKAEAARASEASMRDVVRCNGAEELERVTKERDEARAALAAKIAAHEHERCQHALTREARDAAAEDARLHKVDADNLRADLAKMHARLAEAQSVEPALVRLYKAAQRARAKWGGMTQARKLIEECGEYTAEAIKEDGRYDEDRVKHEAHDVLTVALSLATPALMLASAERLEARLAK